jgi:hypothetical protein
MKKNAPFTETQQSEKPVSPIIWSGLPFSLAKSCLTIKKSLFNKQSLFNKKEDSH